MQITYKHINMCSLREFIMKQNDYEFHEAIWYLRQTPRRFFSNWRFHADLQSRKPNYRVFGDIETAEELRLVKSRNIICDGWSVANLVGNSDNETWQDIPIRKCLRSEMLKYLNIFCRNIPTSFEGKTTEELRALCHEISQRDTICFASV